METWLTAPWPEIWKTAASTVLIMCALLVIVRVYGLRSFAKMSSVDFASTVATGSILATVVMNTGQSLLKGAIAVIVVIGFQQFFSWLKRKSDTIEELTENSPKYLMIGTEIIEENMASSGVTHSDLMAKLREANVLSLTNVKAVIFETTGDISVLHGEGSSTVDEEILSGVER
ncbi:DUF421 domain-containing protein [Neolewinella antarctica]|uniref:Uncharacterized membrane protein YcaP (DUF421 family) n=1 Tax=Neolewinella antarctica TaxID=442734 RepID=A0ABX0XD08_9BACT|nr:YetF domain-containing protein [Neolewinella antarctica]NJC27087.1 uncharacterized membrane protein YcaP (DUF421 family) [Neolewinella antarctica]